MKATTFQSMIDFLVTKAKRDISKMRILANISVFLMTGFVFISRVNSFPFRKQLHE